MAKFVQLTFKIVFDVLTFLFDLRSWNMSKGAHIHTLIPLFWRIKPWNRLRNGKAREFDLILTSTSQLQSWTSDPDKSEGEHTYRVASEKTGKGKSDTK